jgi:seryl-tRNA synthetase
LTAVAEQLKQLAAAREESAALRRQLAAAQEESAALRRQLAAAQGEAAALRHQDAVARLRAACEDFVREVDGRQRQLADLQRQLADVQRENERLTSAAFPDGSDLEDCVQQHHTLLSAALVTLQTVALDTDYDRHFLLADIVAICDMDAAVLDNLKVFKRDINKLLHSDKLSAKMPPTLVRLCEQALKHVNGAVDFLLEQSGDS